MDHFGTVNPEHEHSPCSNRIHLRVDPFTVTITALDLEMAGFPSEQWQGTFKKEVWAMRLNSHPDKAGAGQLCQGGGPHFLIEGAGGPHV